MPLVKCPDCEKEVSDKAETCPGCARPLQIQGATVEGLFESLLVVMGLFIVGVPVVLLYSYISEQFKEPKIPLKKPVAMHNTMRNAQRRPHQEKWYEGGTLHKSTVAQWKRAVRRNKIATAADWVMVSCPSVKELATSSGDINKVKPYAESLVKNVDIAVEGNTVNEQQKITGIVAPLMIIWKRDVGLR